MKRVPAILDLSPWNEVSPYAEHRLIRIGLANGQVLHFRSKRDAQAFAADTRRFLDLVLLDANALLGIALQEHRSAWPLLADLQSKDLANTDNTIRGALDRCTLLLDRATPLSNTTDGQYHAWRHVRNALTELQGIFEHLERVYKYKTFAPLRWRMASYAKQCVDGLMRLQNYGTEQAQQITGRQTR